MDPDHISYSILEDVYKNYPHHAAHHSTQKKKSSSAVVWMIEYYNGEKYTSS